MVVHFTRKLRRAVTGAAVAIAVAFVLLMPAAVEASGTIRYVDDDGNGSTTGCSGNKNIPSSIQAAVNQSSQGDLVIVCPGTYIGRVTVDVPRLTIRGRDPWTAIVKPAPNHPSGAAVIAIQNAHHVKIKWLQLAAPTSGQCAAIGAMILVSNSPGTEVRANHIGISGDQGLGPCGFDVGVRVQDSSFGARVAFNRVTDFQTAGIFLTDSPDVVTLGNTLRYFHAALQPLGCCDNSFGILTDSNATGVRISGNVVRGLPSGGQSTPILINGIFINHTPALVKDNTIRYAAQVIVFLEVQGGRIVSNTARRVPQSGFSINASHGTLIRDNTVKVAGGGMVAGASTSGLIIRDNDFDGPGAGDCFDISTGSGTAGTANTWTNNIGTSAIPPQGICEPE